MASAAPIARNFGGGAVEGNSLSEAKPAFAAHVLAHPPSSRQNVTRTGNHYGLDRSLVGAEPRGGGGVRGSPEGKVRKEVEHGLFGAKSPPRLSFAALVYLRVLRSAELELGVSARHLLFRRIAEALTRPKPPDLLELNEVWIVKLGPLVRELAERIDGFERWKRQRVVLRDDILGGEPAFAGTRLAIRRVGSLAERGETTKAILEDYPYLEAADIDFARLYAKAYPRLGRPREAR